MCAAAVDQSGHVALRVLQVEVLRAVALHHIYHILPHISTLHPLFRHLFLTFPHFSLMHKNPAHSGSRFVLYTAAVLPTVAPCAVVGQGLTVVTVTGGIGGNGTD